MTKYEIKIAVPDIGPVKHVVRADSPGEAQERVQRAHPRGVIISVEKVRAAA